MARYKNVNGVRIKFTAEEEAIRDEEERQSVIKTQNKINAQTTLEENKISGKAKLKAGEALNDAELSALFGD